MPPRPTAPRTLYFPSIVDPTSGSTSGAGTGAGPGRSPPGKRDASAEPAGERGDGLAVAVPVEASGEGRADMPGDESPVPGRRSRRSVRFSAPLVPGLESVFESACAGGGAAACVGASAGIESGSSGGVVSSDIPSRPPDRRPDERGYLFPPPARKDFHVPVPVPDRWRAASPCARLPS